VNKTVTSQNTAQVPKVVKERQPYSQVREDGNFLLILQVVFFEIFCFIISGKSNPFTTFFRYFWKDDQSTAQSLATLKKHEAEKRHSLI